MQSTASFMNISTRHINRILNEHFGMTFKKMLVYMRISKTKHYLFTPNYSIEKISELVGFSSPRILGKQFKEKKYINVIALTEVLSNMDPVNEIAFYYKIHTFNQMNDMEKASQIGIPAS